jgi:hypothetical protein
VYTVALWERGLGGEGLTIPQTKRASANLPSNIEFINIKSTSISYETSLHSAQECSIFIV